MSKLDEAKMLEAIMAHILDCSAKFAKDARRQGNFINASPKVNEFNLGANWIFKTNFNNNLATEQFTLAIERAIRKNTGAIIKDAIEELRRAAAKHINEESLNLSCVKERIEKMAK